MDGLEAKRNFQLSWDGIVESQAALPDQCRVALNDDTFILAKRLAIFSSSEEGMAFSSKKLPALYSLT